MRVSDDKAGSADSGRGMFPWIIWFLGSLCFSFAFFQRITPSVMTEDLMRDFGVTAVVIGTLSALYFYAYACLQVPIGVFVDRWGPRRMLAGAIALNGIGTLMFATTGDLGVAYLGRVLIGIGSAVGWVGSLKLISVWFPQSRFAMLSGCTAAMGMAGAILGQAPVAASVGAFGWRGTLGGVAVFAFVFAVLLLLVLRDDPAGRGGAERLRLASVVQGLRRSLTNRQTWIFATLCGVQTAPQASFAALWGVPYLMQAYGIERTTAAGVTSVLLIGWGVGSPLAGWLSDRVGRRKPILIVGSLIALLTMSAIVYLPGLSLISVQVLLLVNGIASGSMVLCFASAREHNDPRAAGGTIGFVNMATMLVSALGQSIIGWVLDLNWDGGLEGGVRVYGVDAFQSAFLTLVACGVIAVTASLLARETFARQVQAR